MQIKNSCSHFFSCFTWISYLKIQQNMECVHDLLKDKCNQWTYHCSSEPECTHRSCITKSIINMSSTFFLSSFENKVHQASFLTSSAKGLLSSMAVDCLSQPDKRAPLTSVSSGMPWGWAEGREKAEGWAGWKTRVSQHCCKVSTPANGAVLGQGALRIDPAKGGMYKPKIKYCRGHGTAPSPSTAR